MMNINRYYLFHLMNHGKIYYLTVLFKNYFLTVLFKNSIHASWLILFIVDCKFKFFYNQKNF